MPTNTSTVSDHHGLQKTIILSAQHIVASIERVEASSAGIQSLLCKVVETQAQNQQQMMEMLKILANNNNINASISNEAAGNSPIVNEQNRPSVPTTGDEIGEVVENESSVQHAQNQQLPMMEMLKTLLANDASIVNEAVGNRPIIIPNYEQHPPSVPIVGTEVVQIGSSKINEQQKAEDKQVNQENDQYQPLIEALNSQDWKKAMEYLHDHQTFIKETIGTYSTTRIYNILTTVAYFHQYTFVEEFLKLVPPETLESLTPGGNTVLHAAAFLGDIRFVKALVKKNSRLTQIRSTDALKCVPLTLAAINATDGQKEVVEYLCSVTRDDDPSPFSGEDGFKLLLCLMLFNMHGVALSVCQRFPGLVVELMDRYEEAYIPRLMQFIVDRPFSFLSGSKMKWWERYIYSLIEVDTDGEKHEVLENSEGIRIGDEENPRETSIRENCWTSNKRIITKLCLIDDLFFHVISVPLIRRLYDQKLMHKNIVALTKYFFTQLVKKGMDKNSVKTIFLDCKLLLNAIKFGTTEFVLECLGTFPFLCLELDDKGTMMKLVVSERNEVIYNFMRILKNISFTGRTYSLYEDNNSILHFSAELPHSRRLNVVSGAAFQMQRELQWFKMVENTMLQNDRFVRNKDGDTAHFLFTEKHKELMKEGEDWMKDLSTSCMVVAALIATVAFAAAITVPGGNLQDNNSNYNGLPVFLKENSFMVFATADALALFSSITSVLMFLAVFTSRYSEEDFLKALPQRLIIGLAMLFISMASILVSFGAAFIIILEKQFHWAPIAVSLFSCAPVLLFGFLQFPLFVEMVSSTYWPTIFRKQDRHIYFPYLQEVDRILVLKMMKEEK
ncbi:hypothetical protein MKX03_023248 [Papaver bracteatum]|nr:hypothetical protein MKX03_023248 [Papaver bracteatum]